MEEDEIKNENNDEIESIPTTSKSESVKDEAQSISAAASIFKLHGKFRSPLPNPLHPTSLQYGFQESNYRNSLQMDR